MCLFFSFQLFERCILPYENPYSLSQFLPRPQPHHSGFFRLSTSLPPARKETFEELPGKKVEEKKRSPPPPYWKGKEREWKVLECDRKEWGDLSRRRRGLLSAGRKRREKKRRKSVKLRRERTE